MGKTKSLEEILLLAKKLKKEGKIIAFTNGCFDILHPGHIKILKEAKKKADILIVGLNSNISVKKIKGPQRPILSQSARAKILESIKYVDYVVIFNEKTPYNLIKRIKPDYLIKGADWTKEKVVGGNLAKNVFLVKLKKGYSTTNIINTIIKKYISHK